LRQSFSQPFHPAIKALVTVKQIIKSFVPVCLAVQLQMTAYAHPGHGQSGPTHYVTEPDHAVVIIAALLAITMITVAGRMMVLRVNSSS
jgi:hypothetical protein